MQRLGRLGQELHIYEGELGLEYRLAALVEYIQKYGRRAGQDEIGSQTESPKYVAFDLLRFGGFSEKRFRLGGE